MVGVNRSPNRLDLLNDCFDQIYDYFQDTVEFDEDTVVEYLRSNDYDVQDAIDFILENGARKEAKPEPLKVNKQPITTSNYTVPKGCSFTFLWYVESLAAALAMSVPSMATHSPPFQDKLFTVEQDLMPRTKIWVG